MTLDSLLLILRAVSGVLLLGFLGAVFWILWRDYRAAARMVFEEKRQRGRLVILRSDPEVVTLMPDAPTAEYPDLAALAGAGSGTSFPLLPVTSIGRAPTNTVVLTEPFCSQEHALLARRDGQWWLEDLHSSNGTLLNGTPVIEPMVVSSGDVIGIGRVQLKVELS